MTKLNLEDFLPYKLSILSQTVSKLIAQAYETRFGLTMNQWRCMVIISSEQNTTAKAICDKTLLEKMMVSRALKSLNVRGLIQSSPVIEDARKRQLVLTSHGEKIYEEILPIAQEYEQSLINSLSDSQKKSFDAIFTQLMKVSQNLSN